MHDHGRPTPERLGAFSDGVFAVIITIMVLELKPPPQPSFAALLPLWPTVVSYAVSYLFIAIVWVNHHHLLRFAGHATPRLIWWNFAHLFAVSLVPVSTAWVAVTRFAAAPAAVYAAVFVMVNSAYVAFVWPRPAKTLSRGLMLSTSMITSASAESLKSLQTQTQLPGTRKADYDHQLPHC